MKSLECLTINRWYRVAWMIARDAILPLDTHAPAFLVGRLAVGAVLLNDRLCILDGYAVLFGELDRLVGLFGGSVRFLVGHG